VLIIYVLKSQDIINSTIIFVKLLIPLLSYGIISIVIDKFGIDSFSKLLFRANLAACFVGIIVFYAFGDTSYLMVYRGEVISRMTGSFIQPNVFCAFLILTIPFGIHTIISKYRWGGIIN
jgi:glucose uptake protein GlcU